MEKADLPLFVVYSVLVVMYGLKALCGAGVVQTFVDLMLDHGFGPGVLGCVFIGRLSGWPM